jgi:diguanylate cyclase (GGDEF)-like protein
VLVNLSTSGGLGPALGIGAGNTLEALAAAWLINRYANGRLALDRTAEIFKAAGFIAAASALTSATIGVATLAAFGLLTRDSVTATWVTWWLGNLSGGMIVLPIILHWANHRPVTWDPARAAEVLALAISAVTAALIVFSPVFASARLRLPLEFLIMPVVVWASFRFSPRAAATVVLPISVVAVWGTLHGYGPFVRPVLNESLLLLQGFMAVIAIIALVLSSEIAERRKAEFRYRQLAVSDPVTGLPNYRQLVSVIDAEIRRSQRTVRNFAVLFLDLDGLKAINDRYGHLVGSRALSRLAEVLCLACRSMDTAARYGGDEFALVLPETGEPAARQVGVRVCQRLAADTEKPSLSVSIGVAIYPRDGDTAEALLATADKALYESKARGGGGVSTPR